ncbi:hypothetical protein TNCV_4712741 [Trichonephila clavipes]|nr:hypothetical protein TNCV_4712741 [Trichonephila clavipes]
MVKSGKNRPSFGHVVKVSLDLTLRTRINRSHCQNDWSIDRPSILCSRYSHVVDFNRDGLLSQEPMELGPKRRMPNADLQHSPNKTLFGGVKEAHQCRFKLIWSPG